MANRQWNKQIVAQLYDFGAVVRAIEAVREIGNQRAFDSMRESKLIPGPEASAEKIPELARLASASFGHAVGTCKMGVDKAHHFQSIWYNLAPLI